MLKHGRAGVPMEVSLCISLSLFMLQDPSVDEDDDDLYEYTMFLHTHT